MSLAQNYTLRALIRETAAVRVHRGFRNADGRPVAVKLLRDEYPSDLRLARLRHEHEIIASINAPGVVRTHGLEPTGNGLALILDDAGDNSLDRLIHADQLSLRQALQLAIAITRTVASVHERNVLHKDLKPSHVLVNPQEPTQITLVDFGIATRLTRERQSVSTLDRLEGSLPYMAPEQTGRMNRMIDRRSDLYSLGVMLYELFTGRLPFTSADPLELVHSHLARNPEPPGTHRADLPPILSDIILKLLQKMAELRYQSAFGLASDLERCLEDLELRSRVMTFSLGEQDFVGELRIPQRLYGRDAEIARLMATYDRVKEGASELLLVAGYSGIGKSALVHELHRHLVTGGYFASGTFEHLNRSVPYAALAHACQELVRADLAQPTDVLLSRKQRLTEALGANGQVMVDLVPELALILGPQPDVPDLGPAEAQRRLERVFQNFLLAFTQPMLPLVLFLDDLQ